jgi:hypothetical protein
MTVTAPETIGPMPDPERPVAPVTIDVAGGTTPVDPAPAAGSSDGALPVVRRRRASPDTEPEGGRGRRIVWWQAATTVFFVALLAALGLVGYRATLQITGGANEMVTDPDAPNFVAEVKPSPVDLIAVTSPEGELVSVLVLMPEPDGSGGTVVPVPADAALISEDEVGSVTLDTVFREGGLETLRSRLGQGLTFGFTDAFTMPAETLESLVRTAGPITINNPDNVNGRALDGSVVTLFRAGRITLEPDDVITYLRSTDGPVPNQSLRHQAVWEAIISGLDGKDLSELSELGSDEVLPGKEQTTATEVLPQLLAGDVRYDTVPLTPIPVPRTLFTAFIPDPAAMPDFVARNVAAPTSGVPGQRARVRLLNGTPDRRLPATVVPDLVRAGGEVTFLGNAESFDVATTRVEYVVAEASGAAEAIAAELGVPATRAPRDIPNVDVNVVLGRDRLA